MPYCSTRPCQPPPAPAATRVAVSLLLLLHLGACATADMQAADSGVEGNDRGDAALGDAVAGDPAMDDPAVALDCGVAEEGWSNKATTPEGRFFTVELIAVPSQNNMNGLFGLSAGAASDFDDVAVAVRFSPSGMIDVRDGDVYNADVPMPYDEGAEYRVRIDVDVPGHQYSVVVTAEDGTPVLLATGHDFRSTQSAVTVLDNRAAWNDEGFSQQLCNVGSGPPVCGNGVQEDGELCDDGNTAGDDCCAADCLRIESSGVVCRAAAAECDVAEVCDGESGLCPSDEFTAPGCGSEIDDIFLLIGQSNMAGRAPIESVDEPAPDGVYVLDDEGRWTPASNMSYGLNRYTTAASGSTAHLARLAPGATFGRDVAEATGRRIGLVVNALGGTAIAQWRPVDHEGAYTLFDDALARTRLALDNNPGAQLRGILWHQGESDNRAGVEDYYLDYIDEIVTALRTQLDAPTAVFVAGEVGTWMRRGRRVNPEIRRIPEVVDLSGWVSSEGLTTHERDRDPWGPHFNSESQRVLGSRYAAEVLRLAY